MQRSVQSWLGLFAILQVLGCGNADSLQTLETLEAPSVDGPVSRGKAIVRVDGKERTFEHNWHGSAEITQQDGELDNLEFALGASASDESEADAIGVSIYRFRQLRREPLSLVGSYEIDYAPSRSGNVRMQVAAHESINPALPEGESSGTLTITSHEAGMIRATLSARLEGDIKIDVELEGEIDVSCWVFDQEVGPEEAGLAFVPATFEHEFCAQYLLE